ncbi:hypothetical protein [Clostridium kluyveri]|uniref:Uncharacterized protein n=1 Tax=Clostridium kluyveri TaxID=1534 RepID=A0A1L5F644_CLOKL|nr:hypothetical protein [Clostridium kluyveri]APM38300.1 hypothetical protein BS101_05875 [Clostridium kluyveri]
MKAIPDSNLINLVSEWSKSSKFNEDWYVQLLNIQNKTLEENAKMNYYKNNWDMMEKYIKQYANGLQVLFLEGNEILEKYEKGEFILAYFNATRNVKIDIPTNLPKLQLKEKYNQDKRMKTYNYTPG